MSKGIYITSAEPRSGKSVVVLGIMEMLAGQGGKTGFFRPVVHDERKPDSLTDLIIRRYGLKVPYEMLYGCTYAVARDMIIKDGDDDFVKLILEKYKALEGECDLIVCAGSDFAGPAATLEFDFNAKIANNLGCPMLPVVKGLGKDALQVVTAAQGLLESLEERKCDLLAVVANRVQPQLVEEVAEREIPREIWQAAGGSESGLGTGGMLTKLQAADLARRSGATCIIASGKDTDVLIKIANGEKIGTRFTPLATSLESRKRYILSARRAPGLLSVDEGAAQALNRGGSLLPIGISSVTGVFKRGDTVRIAGPQGNEIARGIVNYDSHDLIQIIRRPSEEIESILGFHFGDEVIHRNDLVLL